MSNPITIIAASPDQQTAAATVAAQWDFGTCDAGTQPYRLVVTGQRLELQPRDPAAGGAVFVDWAAGAAAHRRLFGGGRGQPLAKAAGLRSGVNPSVLDATAGFGRDAFVLACLGCNLTLVERNPVVAALLTDGYRRAREDDAVGVLVQERMHIVHADAITYIQALDVSQHPDVIYLDPMYPERRKSSLVKKEMRALQELIGKDPNAGELLPVALQCARFRVVVKRPISAEPLNKQAPTMSIKGKHHRYDVYVIKAMSS